jgi:mannose-6-phosphate isomerase-like protein (cupin superfamily)
LGAGESRAVRRNSQVIRVVSGNGWITFEGRDAYLSSGEEMLLGRGKHHAVLSALGADPLVYEIR